MLLALDPQRLRSRSAVKSLRLVLWILLWASLAFTVRCWNLRDVFLDGRIFFIDADCYSRMTRARAVDEHPGTILRRHDFENAPVGTVPHTTAPMDYLIVGLKRFLAPAIADGSVIRGQELDLAGALVSPLLAAATAGFLAAWAKTLARPRASAALVVFVFSPILVHGTVLGRPDHQSLLIALLAVALAAELRLAEAPSRAWSIASAVAWSVAIWVSFYEPLVLLALVAVLWIASAPRRLRERLTWLIVTVSVSALAWLIEGFHAQSFDAATLAHFEKWSRTIGELHHADATLFFTWLGWGCVAAPFALLFAARTDRRALPILAALLALAALTLWQVRWGYFLALGFALSLPWTLAPLRRGWIAWLVFAVTLWPVARDWDARLFPSDEAQFAADQPRREALQLRAVAERMRGTGEVFIAPWWLSPALAYWSGQRGVAGSSHESLAGIADTARLYLATDPADAVAILRARGVRWLVADAPERVIETSATLLDTPPPDEPLATFLMRQPNSVAPFFRPVFANDFFKLIAVDAAKFPPQP